MSASEHREPPTRSERGLLTIHELAAFLGVSASAIYAQRSRGETPGTLGIRMGRRIFFDLDEVIAQARVERDVHFSTDEESNE